MHKLPLLVPEPVQPSAVGAEPEMPAVILQHLGNVVIAQAAGLIWILAEMGKFLAAGIEQVDPPAAGGDP